LKFAKNILLLLLALCAGPSLFAGSSNEFLLTLRGDTTVADTTDPATKKVTAGLDTTEISRLPDDTSEIPKKPLTALEAIEDVPLTAEDLYEDWDTTSIHSDKFDVLAFNDTVKLQLIGSYSCGYNHPFNGRKTSDFGFRRYRYHFGVDIDLETGDSVNCVFDGKVRVAQKSKSYGYIVVVRHTNGLETYYAHLSKLLVKPGQDIEAGQVLGLGGNTGRSRGSHLHFEVRYRGQPINPNSIIDFQNNRLRECAYDLSKADFKYLTETIKVTTRTRKGKRRTFYYTPGGPKMATPEAKAAMAGVSSPKISESHPHAHAEMVKPEKTPEKETAKVASAPKTPSKAPAKPGAAVYHTVKKGDTLSALAVKHRTTVAKICQLNGIKTTTVLQIGRKLRVK